MLKISFQVLQIASSWHHIPTQFYGLFGFGYSESVSHDPFKNAIKIISGVAVFYPSKDPTIFLIANHFILLLQKSGE